MNRLVLVGGGGHCKSIIDSAISMGIYDEIVITDAEIKVGTFIMGCKVVGTDEVLPELKRYGYDNAFISVGSIKSNDLRKKLVDSVQEIGFRFPIICDKSAAISTSAFIDEGTFVGKNAVINADAQIGKHCIINTGSIIEHECVIGDFSHISVGSILCGGVFVEESVFLGAGSTVIQGVKIGKDSVIGAGSTVISNVESNSRKNGLIK